MARMLNPRRAFDGSPVSRWSRGTWLEAEWFAYPHGGQTRRGAAIMPDGSLRSVRAGIPDTYFSIPARDSRGRAGYLTVNTDDLEATYLTFRPRATLTVDGIAYDL